MKRITGFILALCLLGCVGFTFATSAARPPGPVDLWYSHRDQDPQGLPRKPMGNEVLYQIFVDRFYDGNTANDCLYDGRFCDPEKRDYYRYWGGDLRGVIDQLPYLKELGVTRVWLTPIFENQMVTVKRNRHGRDVDVTSYHGYWFKDLFRLNPVLTDHGSQDEAIVDELVRAGAPEIEFLLDTVANHTSPSDPSADSLAYLNRIQPLDQSDGVRRTHRGALFENGRYVTSLDEDEQRAGQNGYRRFFHSFGPILNYDDAFQCENFQLDFLSDLDQDNGVVADYLKRAHLYWLRRFPGLAGYRMDTIKHVPQAYWDRLDGEIAAEFPNAEVVGEYFSGGPYNAGSRRYFRETHATIFDFDFRNTVRDVFLGGGPMSRFVDLWNADPGLKDARGLVTFIDNHDIARLRGEGMSYRAMRQAVALMFAARGIPSVFYGLEQDLFYPGDPGDPYNRPMMRSFDRQHELYREIKKLAGLRKANDALRYGSTHVVHVSEHILGFERVNGDKIAFFITSKNPIAGRDSFDVTGLRPPDGAYRDVLTDREYEVRQGKVHVDLGNGDIVILSTSQRVR
jgi:cyclomaltodextrin glucanotransferase